MGISEQELQEVEARAEKATEGPWRVGNLGRNINTVYSGPENPIDAVGLCIVTGVPLHSGVENITGSEGDSNAALIAHARTDVPRLIAEVRRLRKALGLLCFLRGTKLLCGLKSPSERRNAMDRREQIHSIIGKWFPDCVYDGIRGKAADRIYAEVVKPLEDALQRIADKGNVASQFIARKTLKGEEIGMVYPAGKEAAE